MLKYFKKLKANSNLTEALMIQIDLLIKNQKTILESIQDLYCKIELIGVQMTAKREDIN